MTKLEVPEAYTIGWVPFIHTKIWLDSKPLIPRPETEFWVNEVIHKLKSQEAKKPKFLDLCAGSGCIGVALAKEIPNSQVDFVELDEKHHETIWKNIKENGIDESRARVLGGDLFENIHDQYDLILSNPPYIDMSLGRVEQSVLDHEPKLALDGGEAGLSIINRILSEASEHLAPNGSLYLEHEPEQAEWLSKQPGFVTTHKDQYGVDRWSEFRWS